VARTVNTAKKHAIARHCIVFIYLFILYPPGKCSGRIALLGWFPDELLINLLGTVVILPLQEELGRPATVEIEIKEIRKM